MQWGRRGAGVRLISRSRTIHARSEILSLKYIALPFVLASRASCRQRRESLGVSHMSGLSLRLGIKGRLYALVVVFGLGCVALATTLIWLQGQRAVAARQHSLETLV